MRHLILLLPIALGACGTLTRLSEIGSPPAMTPSSDPTQEPNYRPLSMPMPSLLAAEPTANGLWRPGSRAFFKDQRAAQVGDIVTVLVNITDGADFQNNSTANRTGTEAFGLPNLFGLETTLPKLLPGANANTLLSASSANAAKGAGEVKRTETMTLRLAGVITQVLPNGNLVVSARQEVRVNSELRDLQVSGVIRPQDIASDNTVHHDRMAEARIAYGGRGQLTNVQTPRWGQQVFDALMPF